MPNINLRAFQQAIADIAERGGRPAIPPEAAQRLRPGDMVRIGNEDFIMEGDNEPMPRLQPFAWNRLPPVEPAQKVEKLPGKTGEDLFRLILSGIKEIYDVDAVIAGGAVRDLVAGGEKDCKDVDVFIPMKWENFQKQSAELGWQRHPIKVKTKPYKGKGTESFTSSARAFAVVQDYDVDLVFIEGGLTPERVDSFPVNVQKCVWNLAEGLVISPDARKDLDNKTFTISSRITEKEAIKAVRDKVQSWLKRPCYKGWKIVEPQIKEWWQEQNNTHTVERKKGKKINTPFGWSTSLNEPYWGEILDNF